MNCDETRELLTARAWGRAEPKERAQAEAHLAACPGCRSYADEVQSIRRAVAEELRSLRMPAEVREQLRATAAVAGRTFGELAMDGLALTAESLRLVSDLLEEAWQLTLLDLRTQWRRGFTKHA
jgi:anti-sigma factor RsiW